MNGSSVSSKSFTVKTYKITFTTAHGTAPEAIIGKHKGEKVTLPQAITATGFTFDRWNDGTKDYTAGSEYTGKQFYN